MTSSQQSSTNLEQITDKDVKPYNDKPQDALSVGSSINYFIPSDSDVEDDVQEDTNGPLSPTKIPQ